MAARQGLLLRRPSARDSVAGRYGLIPADLETPALGRARLAEFSMSIDEVEIYLSGATSLDAHFQDVPDGHSQAENPRLE
ncbi:hypothetical protein AB1K56_07020 [Microbacterium sp. BWR-S6Y]|uniref:hypothetical protein n=1 Tax=Microbacterium sp. BWR-S6Y TaxID=3232073 RepID=UPI00352971FB